VRPLSTGNYWKIQEARKKSTAIHRKDKKENMQGQVTVAYYRITESQKMPENKSLLSSVWSSEVNVEICRETRSNISDSHSKNTRRVREIIGST